MKRIIIIALIGMFLGFSGFIQESKKERKAREKLEMAQLIDSGRFKFVARSAHSNLGNFDHLSTGYALIFDGLQLKAALPYYGIAYSAPYGGNGGVNFDLKADTINKEWNEKKKVYTITTELSDSEDTYSIYLSASLSGYSSLKINFRDRQWIEYYGVIEKVE
ncbi:MAG: DUF4251 domain-containing protein [Prolixibacteraceae bacterium]